MESFILELGVAVVSAVFAGAKSIKFAQEGELGIKLRFGRALRDRDGSPRVIPPGFVLLNRP